MATTRPRSPSRRTTLRLTGAAPSRSTRPSCGPGSSSSARPSKRAARRAVDLRSTSAHATRDVAARVGHAQHDRRHRRTPPRRAIARGGRSPDEREAFCRSRLPTNGAFASRTRPALRCTCAFSAEAMHASVSSARAALGAPMAAAASSSAKRAAPRVTRGMPACNGARPGCRSGSATEVSVSGSRSRREPARGALRRPAPAAFGWRSSARIELAAELHGAGLQWSAEAWLFASFTANGTSLS